MRACGPRVPGLGGGGVSGDDETINRRWLDEVASMPDTDDPQRGAKILRASSAMRNISAGYIIEYVRLLLGTGCWRSYTFPNGDHHEWLAAEFDYFLSAIEHDPQLVDLAVRVSGDRDLITRIAEASNQKREPDDRRPLDEVRALPRIGPFIDRYMLGGRNVHEKVLSSSEAKASYLAGVSARDARRRSKRWEVQCAHDEDLAAAIAARLLKDPDLARDVLNALRRASYEEQGKKRSPGAD